MQAALVVCLAALSAFVPFAQQGRALPVPTKNPCKIEAFGKFKGTEIKSVVCPKSIPSTFLIKHGKAKGR